MYMMASGRNGTLYVGVTSDLLARVVQHREHQLKGFTDKYDVTRLVWYTVHDDVTEAIAHEKRLKRWLRKWKLDLIERENPMWRDLYDALIAP